MDGGVAPLSANARADVPGANRPIVHTLAAVAESEREVVAHRTNVAPVAKRGTRSGKLQPTAGVGRSRLPCEPSPRTSEDEQPPAP